LQPACNFLITERSFTSLFLCCCIMFIIVPTRNHKHFSISSSFAVFILSPSQMKNISRQQINNNANVSLIHCETRVRAVRKPFIRSQSHAYTRNFVLSTRNETRRRKARKNFNPAF
jgi:hypothetical protein